MKTKPKSLKIWIILMAAPLPLLIFTAILLTIMRFALGTSGNGSIVMAVVNIFCFLLGVVSVLLLMGLPIWVTMLVVTIENNKKIAQPPVDQP